MSRRCTQGYQCGVEIAPFQFVKHCPEQNCAGRAEWMAKRDSTTVDIELQRIDVEMTAIGQRHDGEGFIDFEQIDVADTQSATLQ
ncbi:hypothetical protein D3C85_1313750 [compost metagenome]